MHKEKMEEKREKRVSETYFSSFISPERKENSVTSTAAEGRLSAAPALVVPSFDSVYFSRFRIFLVHYQREATIHTAATAPHLAAQNIQHPHLLYHHFLPTLLSRPSTRGLLLYSVLREQCKRRLWHDGW